MVKKIKQRRKRVKKGSQKSPETEQFKASG
jgi:hypothetical protein